MSSKMSEKNQLKFIVIVVINPLFIGLKVNIHMNIKEDMSPLIVTSRMQ